MSEIRRGYAQNGAERIVDELIRAAVPKGGRLRPLLCCAGYHAVGGEGGATDPRIVRAAASLELLHTFAIVHDDVMDGSPMRRGEPSIHKRLADERRAAGGRDAELHGMSLAILAGDLALVVSDLLFAESGFPQSALVRAYQPLSEMRLDAIAGQYLDLTHSGRANEDLELSRRITRLKTSSYSVRGPLLVGATLGGGSQESKNLLRAYADPLGDAFQLADDVIGIFGDPRLTGKDAENDIRRGKPTPLIARAVELATPDDRRTIDSTWGNPGSTEADLAALRDAVRRCGAYEEAVSDIRRLVAQAISVLDDPSGHLSAEATELLKLQADAVARHF